MSAVVQAERELFDDAMSCHDTLPADFTAGAMPERRIAGMLDRADALLRTIAQVEDGIGDEGDDRQNDPAVLRLEAKVNVLLELVGGLVGRDLARPPERELRWSRKGIALDTAEPVPDTGGTGVLRLQPSAWLPQLLELPARVIATRAGAEPRLWLRFEPLPETVESAIERHLFRMHRRALARRSQNRREGFG